MAIVSAEAARTEATIQRPILGNPVIFTRDRRGLITALEESAVAGRQTRSSQRNANVRLSLSKCKSAT